MSTTVHLPPAATSNEPYSGALNISDVTPLISFPGEIFSASAIRTSVRRFIVERPDS